MTMLKQRRGVMIVKNNTITLARGCLCLYCLLTIGGLLWSGGDLYISDFIILAVTLLISGFAVQISSPNSLNFSTRREILIINFGLLFFILSILLSYFNFIRSPQLFFLLFAFIPFLMIYFSKKKLRSDLN